ncbi:MAG: hypothetical protein R3293_05425 [Candidatus Promineifilaceae bacterium]|nr:hypothetical protein [Candidatus Promineifilaceae bacterium]
MATKNVAADQALNIGLIRFEAIPLDNAVQIEWDTETELGTAGYRLKRGQNDSYSYLMEPDGNGILFILSEGGPSLGANYTVTDDTTINGENYSYQLIEVTTDGRETLQAEASVTVGLVPTNTPIVLGGGGDSNENKDTATPQVTSTASATSVATQTVNSTSVPSATSIPTVIRTTTPQPTATRAPEDLQITNNELPGSALPNTFNDSQGNASDLDSLVTIGEGIEVAQALDGSTSVDPSSGSDSLSAQDLSAIQNIVPTAVNNSNIISESQPIMIGRVAKIDSTTPPKVSDSNQKTGSTLNIFQGRAFLWIAFVAAIVIFIASVIGAILLYTRRRKKDS